MARRHGDVWYVAAITDWDKRTLNLDLSFLPEGRKFKMEIFKDGINADTRAVDYKHEYVYIEGGRRISVSLAPGGGWVAKISPV